MTAVLIAATCIFLNLALSRAGMFYMDKLGQAIFHQTPTADFMISIPGADVEQLPPDFEIQINDTKKIFTLSSWLITLLITLVSGCITYFVSGYALRPLRSFSDRITQIQAENLMQYQSEEQQIPNFRRSAIPLRPWCGGFRMRFLPCRSLTAMRRMNSAHPWQ